MSDKYLQRAQLVIDDLTYNGCRYWIRDGDIRPDETAVGVGYIFTDDWSQGCLWRSHQGSTSPEAVLFRYLGWSEEEYLTHRFCGKK